MKPTELQPPKSGAVEGRVPLVQLAGTPIGALTEQQCIEHILDDLDVGRGGWVITANLDILRKIVEDPVLRPLAWRADLLVADGMPLVWASWLQGTPLPERVAGSSLVLTLSGQAAARGRSVYLLGGEKGTAERSLHVLRQRFPSIRASCGPYLPFGFEHDSERIEELRRALAEADPDIVFVALGFPKQERVIERLREVCPAAWWLGVGISFSYLCGEVQQAPRWMRRSGLEWVYRMFQEPRRLLKRYLIDDSRFAAVLMASALRHRLSRQR